MELVHVQYTVGGADSAAACGVFSSVSVRGKGDSGGGRLHVGTHVHVLSLVSVVVGGGGSGRRLLQPFGCVSTLAAVPVCNCSPMTALL